MGRKMKNAKLSTAKMYKRGWKSKKLGRALDRRKVVPLKPISQ